MSRYQDNYKYICVLICICIIGLWIRDVLTKEVLGTVHDTHLPLVAFLIAVSHSTMDDSLPASKSTMSTFTLRHCPPYSTLGLSTLTNAFTIMSVSNILGVLSLAPKTKSPAHSGSAIALTMKRTCIVFKCVSTDSTAAILLTNSILAPSTTTMYFLSAAY